MAGSGPPPNPLSRKQTGNQAHTWTDLPANGYDGPTPEWPLPDETEREATLWADLWRTPQAAAWARLSWAAEAAMYVRVLTMAEAGDLKAITEARLRALELGLTPTGMLKNRWRVTDDETAEKRQAKAAPKRKPRRLKVVDDAVAGR